MTAQVGDIVKVTRPDSVFRGETGVVTATTEHGTTSVRLERLSCSMSFGSSELAVVDRPLHLIPANPSTVRLGAAGKVLYTSGAIR